MKSLARDPVEDRDRAIEFNSVEYDLGHVLAREIGWGLFVRSLVTVEFVGFIGRRTVQFEDKVLKLARAR